MKLPNELTEDKSASFALSWSVSWRFFVVAFIVGSVSTFVPHELRFEYSFSPTILTLVVMFLLFWCWVHRLLGKGIGRVKIIFMERKHYDELNEKLSDQTNSKKGSCRAGRCSLPSQRPAAEHQRHEAQAMLRIITLSLIALLSAEALAENLEIEKRTQTINGITSHFVLEVEVEDIMKTPRLDPARDELPMSMSEAIRLALNAYKETYKTEPSGIASVSLDHFPGWDYRDRWHFRVDIAGNPHVNVVVLFNEKVILPKKQ